MSNSGSPKNRGNSGAIFEFSIIKCLRKSNKYFRTDRKRLSALNLMIKEIFYVLFTGYFRIKVDFERFEFVFVDRQRTKKYF